MLQRLNGRPRRVLMTVDAVGGVWHYALDLARELAEAGDTVVLAGLGPRPTPAQARAAEAVATLSWLDTPPEWLAAREAEIEGLDAELGDLVRAHAIDLVQLNAPAQAAGSRLPCPVVAVSHSCVATWFRAVKGAPVPADWAWQQARNRRGFTRADLTVVPSASHAAMLKACYGEVPRLTVVPNAAAAGGGEEADRDDTVFAAARWWDEGKNAAVLDGAAARTGRRVLAAGPTAGPNGQAVAFAHVEALGALPHAEVRRRMAGASLFVSPSRYEPFGLAALEAAQAGTPLVLADIPTYRELWRGAALFFPADDAGALAAAIDRLADDPRERSRLGAAARRRARHFTTRRQAAAMRRAYDRAAAHFAEGR